MAPKHRAVQDLIGRHVAACCARSPEGVAASYTEDAVFSINRAEPKVKSSLGWFDAEEYERQMS